jgi:hypothetical protein
VPAGPTEGEAHCAKGRGQRLAWPLRMTSSWCHRRAEIPGQRAHAVGVEEGEEIAAFFGKLWSVPLSGKNRVPHNPPNLFWIRRDLWESRQFSTKDVFPVQEGDVLSSDQKRGSFAVDFWGRGKNPSYLEVAKGVVPGRTGRGRGRGIRFEEDQWGGGAELVESGFHVVPTKFPTPLRFLPSATSIPEPGARAWSDSSPSRRAASVPGEQFPES